MPTCRAISEVYPLDATIEEFAADGYTHCGVLLPSMPRDQAEADQLAPPHLDGTHHRTALSTAALRRVRWSCTRSSRGDWKTC
jgi:hypothetical protein